jgi:biopolymer transport protein ExbD
MRSVLKACLVGVILIIGISAQKPVFTQGVAVKLAVASHAVEVRGADEQNAAVAAITATGTVFVGISPTEPTALSSLSQRTVYVKADARAPYQTVLAVLDALHGKSVVLISASPDSAPKQGYMVPYGMKLAVSK